jgi:hypothetical protein
MVKIKDISTYADIYGDFPTLEQIRKDYNDFKDTFKDIRTVEQIVDLVAETFMIVEINGMTVKEFLEDGGTNDKIEWIRYEQYGCLTYIYDRFDGNPMFDVFSSACCAEFIQDITIDKLTEEFYNKAKTEAIDIFKLGEVKMNSEKKIVVEGKFTSAHNVDVYDSLWIKEYDGAEICLNEVFHNNIEKDAFVRVSIETDKVEQSVPVVPAPVNEKDVLEAFIKDLIFDVVDDLSDSKFSTYEQLDYLELTQIEESILRNDDYRGMLANGTFRATILELYKEILDNRVQYYRYTVPYNGYVEFTVKAHSQEEAEEYIDSMSHYSLAEYVNEYDIEFDTYDKELDDWTYDEPFEDYEDAT